MVLDPLHLQFKKIQIGCNPCCTFVSLCWTVCFDAELCSCARGSHSIAARACFHFPENQQHLAVIHPSVSWLTHLLLVNLHQDDAPCLLCPSCQSFSFLQSLSLTTNSSSQMTVLIIFYRLNIKHAPVELHVTKMLQNVHPTIQIIMFEFKLQLC